MEADIKVPGCAWQPGDKWRVKMAERAESQALELREEKKRRRREQNRTSLGPVRHWVKFTEPRKLLSYLKPSLEDSFQF